MCLRAQVIDNNDGVIGGVRWARGLSDNYGGVVRGRGIHDTSDGLETMTEAAGSRLQAQGIYNNDGGVGRGR